MEILVGIKLIYLNDKNWWRINARILEIPTETRRGQREDVI